MPSGPLTLPCYHRAWASLLNDSKHWRDRAQEARAIADETDTELIRRSMLRIAEEYERVAEKADGRAKSDK